MRRNALEMLLSVRTGNELLCWAGVKSQITFVAVSLWTYHFISSY